MISKQVRQQTAARRHRAVTAVGSFLLALAVMVLAGMSVSASDGNNRSGESRPTIVLVHGGWAGPESWSRVVSRLNDEGFVTVTPTLGLDSLAGDVAIVQRALDEIPGKKVLVGHSYGGEVITNAAFGRSDVVSLVYTAAFAPDQGESLQSLGAGYNPPAAVPHLIFSGAPFASPCLIDPTYFRADFAQDLSPSVAAALSAQQRAFNFPIFFTPSGPAAWHNLPTWYAVSGADRMIDPALERAMAARMGAHTVVFEDASHAGGFTHYAGRFSEMIEQAAAQGDE
jgi:pimeloyl-ACP methyl ester carboxylesterase